MSAELRGGRWVEHKGVWRWIGDDLRATNCGTDGGYYHHRRITHTEPCEPCKSAHAAAEATRSRKRRTAALLAERNIAHWWATPPRIPDAEEIARMNEDTELVTARRRRVLATEMDEFERSARAEETA